MQHKLFLVCPPRYWGFDVSPPHDLGVDQPLPEYIRQYNHNQQLQVALWLKSGRLYEGSLFVKLAFLSSDVQVQMAGQT